MTDYTPDEDDFRYAWLDQLGAKEDQFDQFLDRIRAEALREAADEYATSNREQAHGATSVLMFMHHRADRIERGER